MPGHRDYSKRTNAHRVITDLVEKYPQFMVRNTGIIFLLANPRFHMFELHKKYFRNYVVY